MSSSAETTWSYFKATRNYVERWGRPVAFYTDKHSVFRINAPEQDGQTQFARALSELHIDLICANAPQAKGRVERANRTLQDRLVKEMRDLGISDIDSGNAMLETFRLAHNKRFACDPQSAHDAHRRLRYADKLDSIISTARELKAGQQAAKRRRAPLAHCTSQQLHSGPRWRLERKAPRRLGEEPLRCPSAER